MAFRRGPQPRPRAKTRRPGRLVLDEHEAFERGQVAARRMGHQRGIRPADIGRHGCDRGVGGHVSRQRPHEPVHALRIVSHAVDSLHVDPRDLPEVVPVRPHGFPRGDSEMSGPPSHAHQFGEVARVQAGFATRHGFAREDRTQRHGARRAAEFEKRHRTQPQPAETPGAAVPCEIVARHGGPCEDELSLRLTIVHGVADMVPQVGLQLPLVDQAGRGARQDFARLQSGKLAGLVIHIQKHFARRDPAGGPRLAACSGSFDHDRP